MFDRLSNLIIKKPWAILAIWAIIIIVSVPLALSLDGHLHYDITSFIPGDLQSSKANDQYQQLFPGQSPDQIIVAVQSANKTQAMLYIRALNDSVSKDPRILNCTGTTSIYDIQAGALTSMAPQLYGGMYSLYDLASNTSGQLYDARDQAANASRDLYSLYDTITDASSQMAEAYGTVKGTSEQLYAARDQVAAGSSGMYQVYDAAEIVYGVPAYYTNVWATVRPGVPDDATANAMAAQQTQSNVVNGIPDPDMNTLATEYLARYNQTWTAVVVSNPAAAAGNPLGAAQQTMDLVAGPFFAAAPLTDQQHRAVTALLTLKLANYGTGHTTALKNLIINITMGAEGMTSDQDRQELSAIYDLNENPSASAIDGLTLSLATSGLSASDAASARAIYALGRNPSDDAIGTYVVAQADVGLNDTGKQIVQDAWSLRHGTAQDFDNYVIQKASEGQNASQIAQIKAIYALGKDPSGQTIDDYVLDQACVGRNATESQVIRDVYALGPDPGAAALENFSVSEAADSLNITGNLSFFNALFGLGPNASSDAITALATDWAYTHDYTDPQLFPATIEDSLASGDLTLYAVMLNISEASETSHNAVAAIRDDVANTTGYEGVTAYVTGMSAIGVDTANAAANDVGNIDKISVVLILLILGVYFLSILTPFVPLLVIGAAILTGFGVLFLSSYTVDLYYLTKTFMIVVMLGAGTDYCVFILSRYAEERNIGKSVPESVRFAIEHAGKSILCSGLTAMIGFASLMLIDNGMFHSIGQSMALAILVSMLVALTLIPAILMLAGDRLFWPRKIYNIGRKPSRIGGFMKKVSRGVIRHAGLVLVITLVLAVPAVWLYLQLQPGQDVVSMLPNSLESKTGYNMLDQTFGSGNIDKANIVVTLPVAIDDAGGNYSLAALDRIEAMSAIVASVPGVDKVYSMSRPDGTLIDYGNLSEYSVLQQAYYRTTMDNDTGIDGRSTVISVAFQGSPYSEDSDKAIDSIRDRLAAYADGAGNGTTVALGGNAAMSYDFQNEASSRFGIVIALVFAGIFIVLAALLRSVLTPVKLFVSMLMGIVWTLAIFTIVFQYWMGEAIIWILPITLFCTLMGLGGDYVVFMMSRIHEEIEKGASDEDAILSSVEITGPVILLCGLVMASAFGSMMISSMAEILEFGFVLCLAIILDATLMVLVLIPSIMMVARKYNWWSPFARRPQQEKKP